MTSSNGNNFRVTGPLCGEIPSQTPVRRSFNVFFDLRLNKRLSKQSWGWWFETLSHSLWRHIFSYLILSYLILSYLIIVMTIFVSQFSSRQPSWILKHFVKTQLFWAFFQIITFRNKFHSYIFGVNVVDLWHFEADTFSIFRVRHFEIDFILFFIRPFEKRDVLCRGNVRPSVCPSVCPSVRPSVRPRFPDFFSTCFEISIWNLVYTFSRWHDMSSLSCITIGSLWPSLQPKVGQTYFFAIMAS